MWVGEFTCRSSCPLVSAHWITSHAGHSEMTEMWIGGLNYHRYARRNCQVPERKSMGHNCCYPREPTVASSLSSASSPSFNFWCSLSVSHIRITYVLSPTNKQQLSAFARHRPLYAESTEQSLSVCQSSPCPSLNIFRYTHWSVIAFPLR